MADGLTLNSGSGGAVVSTDDAGVDGHVQRVKLALSADGSATHLEADSDGLKVKLGTAIPSGDNTIGRVKITDGTDVALVTAAGALTVDGSATTQPVSAASLPLPTGAATEATLAAIDAGKLEETTFTGRIGEVQESPTQYTVLERLKVLADLLTTIDADTGNLTGILTALQTIDNMISGNEAQVDVVAALPAGNNNIGDVDIASIAAGDNNIGNVDVVTLPALPAGTNNIGDVDVLSIAAGTNTIGDVGVKPRTSGGLTTAMFSGSDGSSILVATAQVVKASAGQLFGYYAYNPEAAVTFVHFYNTAAASVTVGTTNPLFTLPIPAGSAANLMSDIGIAFSNAGWSVAATTTAGGNTAPATGVSLVVWYA